MTLESLLRFFFLPVGDFLHDVNSEMPGGCVLQVAAPPPETCVGY